MRKRLEAEGQLLGRGRVLLAPELEEARWIEAPDHRQPMHPGMAGAAERHQQGQTRAPWAAVMDNQRSGRQARRGADATEAAVARDHRRPEAAIATPVMLLAGVAGRAQTAFCHSRGTAPAPQRGLAAQEGSLLRRAGRPLPCPAAFCCRVGGQGQIAPKEGYATSVLRPHP